MCGICGYVEFSGTVVARERLARMCRAMVHRGPDAEGSFVEPGIGLGQRRLAIIDLDDRATAPLANEDGTVWVTFNGEIYNFRELRAELKAAGHVFRTDTDTEVLVHLYEASGDACVDRLRGMFAFALWDGRRRRLLAARDRMGKKPFVYAHTGRQLVFASELGALLHGLDVSPEPDYVAIDAYLRRQYVPSPMTAFAGVRRLPPGHLLTCTANGTLEVRRYWRPPVPTPLDATLPELEEELLRRLREAVRVRMISDVPLGAFLSGGIDSSAVVALMAEESTVPVRTFSIGFEDAAFDESPYARMVAERYGTEHHAFVVRPDAAALLPLLVRHYGEPFADASALPTFYLARETRNHVTVALSGDGGDESFAGYAAYAHVARWQRADRLGRPLRKAIAASAASVLNALPYGNTTARLARAAAMIGGNLPQRYELATTLLKPQERNSVYTWRFHSLIQKATADVVNDTPGLPDEADAFDWMMRHDQMHYLPDCLMVKVDIASMANSLEVRSPFLDQDFAAFAAAIPSRLKRNGGEGKQILRSALRGVLPEAVLEKSKAGFGVPLAKWLRSDLHHLLRSNLLDDTAMRRGLFEPTFVRRLVDDHAVGRRDWSNRLWALLFLELWFREFID